jgi:hypothetical protein
MAPEPSSPQKRSELTAEARGLAAAALEGPPETFDGAASSSSVLLASIAARASVDELVPSGRLRPLKRLVLKASNVFLRTQTDVNLLTVRALEDLSGRVEALEARVEELEGGR